jgi:hypothetical protein
LRARQIACASQGSAEGHGQGRHARSVWPRFSPRLRSPINRPHGGFVESRVMEWRNRSSRAPHFRRLALGRRRIVLKRPGPKVGALSARARASSAASERTSSGPTAIAGDRATSESTATTRKSYFIWVDSAGKSAVLLLAGFGAPRRKRRSASDSAPPMTITTAPNQTSRTNVL